MWFQTHAWFFYQKCNVKAEVCGSNISIFDHSPMRLTSRLTLTTWISSLDHTMFVSLDIPTFYHQVTVDFIEKFPSSQINQISIEPSLVFNFLKAFYLFSVQKHQCLSTDYCHTHWWPFSRVEKLGKFWMHFFFTSPTVSTDFPFVGASFPMCVTRKTKFVC